MNFKFYTISIAFVALLFVAACKTSKNNTNTTNKSTEKVEPQPGISQPVGPLVTVRSKNGVNAPVEEDLNAIKVQFPEVTMVKLNEGHELYTKTACLECHKAKGIYGRSVEEWSTIIDDMSNRAKLTASQKDAVLKYILAIKATQPK